ncbi:HAD-IA family hydrolase [Sphingomonas nostoxanthinifaciens]|uniref:HAD-IA family hydrolase n=1 Tax=Sphingomonas nostoxanthinifaciens TaxID=2872652 RepID=UPI001CC1F81B|nr:HAD-IA family hydrolase [Sphingomonas nostoxanthinifaciens]UAK24782.1 HAD-IA family hydrolase [Sphingomonas nostoxanthinifaciens]
MSTLSPAPTATTASLRTGPYAAFLFDMDGTLLTSIAASRRVWSGWAARHGLDAADFLPRSHGMRIPDIIASLAIPGVDPAREAAIIVEREMTDLADVSPIAGAADFLRALPPERWTVVTSAPRALAEVRLQAAGLPKPALLVTAEDIERGKPDPACFLLAAERLGVAPADCLVFEDAAAGVRAGVAAGAEVLVITAVHDAAAGLGHAAVRDYRNLRIGAGEYGLQLTIVGDDG